MKKVKDTGFKEGVNIYSEARDFINNEYKGTIIPIF